MHCPFCSGRNSLVKDSRCSGVVRRRRVCAECGEKFTTLERVCFPSLQVIKRSQTQNFDKEILLKDLSKAFDKNTENLESTLESVVDFVVKDLHLLKVRKVDVSQIVHSAIKFLSSVDKTAAVKFALLHKNFDSFDHLLDFVSSVSKKVLNEPLP